MLKIIFCKKYLLRGIYLLFSLLLCTPSFSQTEIMKSLYTSGDCSPIFVSVEGSVEIKCGITAEQAYWEAISTSEKIFDFNNYIARYPDGKFVTVAKMKIRNLEKSHTKAVSHFQTAMKHINAVGVGGDVETVVEQHDRALLNLRLSIENYPHFAEAYFEIGKIYWWKSEYEKSLEPFKRAIDINPVYSEAYLYEGFSYENIGEPTLACLSYLAFQATNNYLTDDLFEHYGYYRGAFTEKFLEYRGCRRPAGFKLGKTQEEFDRKVNCDTTNFSDEIEECASQGHAASMHRVAYYNIWVDAWNNQDEKAGQKAYDIWRKLADEGDYRGYYGVAMLSSNDFVIRKNCSLIVDYFTRAAEAEYDRALVGLGFVYLRNECAKRDIPRARSLFARAAVLGNSQGQGEVENIDSCPSNPNHYLQPCK